MNRKGHLLYQFCLDIITIIEQLPSISAGVSTRSQTSGVWLAWHHKALNYSRRAWRKSVPEQARIDWFCMNRLSSRTFVLDAARTTSKLETTCLIIHEPEAASRLVPISLLIRTPELLRASAVHGRLVWAFYKTSISANPLFQASLIPWFTALAADTHRHTVVKMISGIQVVVSSSWKPNGPRQKLVYW